MLVKYYVTQNRRAPFLALYGEWPMRSGFRKMAAAGVRIGVREAPAEEAEQVDASPRFIALKWGTLLEMLRDAQDHYGPGFRRQLMAGIRAHREEVEDRLKAGDRKRLEYENRRHVRR